MSAVSPIHGTDLVVVEPGLLSSRLGVHDRTSPSSPEELFVRQVEKRHVQFVVRAPVSLKRKDTRKFYSIEKRCHSVNRACQFT